METKYDSFFARLRHLSSKDSAKHDTVPKASVAFHIFPDISGLQLMQLMQLMQLPFSDPGAQVAPIVIKFQRNFIGIFLECYISSV
jgi:hypothetical protein